MEEHNLRDIARRLEVKVVAKNGPWLQAPCPFAGWLHPNGTDRNPSFGLLINEGAESYYKCFTCKQKGIISSLVRSLEHYREESYPGLALDADRKDMEFSLPEFGAFAEEAMKAGPEPLNEDIHANLYDWVYDYDNAVTYLEGRGIDFDAADKMDLRFDPEEQRIIFPVRGRGKELYGFTGRSILTPENYLYKNYPKIRDYHGLPKEHLLLGAEFVEDGKPVFVVEGLFGYAHLIKIGAQDLVNPIALLGSEMTSHKANLLMDWGLPVFLMADDDEAGDICLFGSLNEFGDYRGGGAVDQLKNEMPLFLPAWPEGKTDPDELTMDDLGYMLTTLMPI